MIFNLLGLFYFRNSNRRSKDWVLLNHSRVLTMNVVIRRNCLIELFLQFFSNTGEHTCTRSTVLSFHLSKGVRRKMLVSSWPCYHSKNQNINSIFLKDGRKIGMILFFFSTNLSGFPFSILAYAGIANMFLLNTNCTKTSFLDSVKNHNFNCWWEKLWWRQLPHRFVLPWVNFVCLQYSRPCTLVQLLVQAKQHYPQSVFVLRII